MNLLLVDDDAYVTEAIEASMDWEKLGIKSVYTAHSVSRAMKIIEDVKIHILICDIEMPKANGFALIRWIKEQDFLITYILLTSYAEFEYANQAIKLSSFAYALKPVDYEELTDILANAIQKEKELLEALNYRKGYDAWNDSAKSRKDSFWRNLLLDRQITGMAEIEAYIKKTKLNYSYESYFTVMTITYYFCEEVQSKLGQGMFCWTVKNIIEELLLTQNTRVESVVCGTDGTDVIIIGINANAENQLNIIVEKANEIIAGMVKYYHASCGISIGSRCRFDEFEEDYGKLLKMNEQHVDREGKAILLKEFNFKEIVYQPPKWALWEKFIEDRKEDVLQTEVGRYLDNLVESEAVNCEILNRFVMEFMQIYNAVLRKKEFLPYIMDYTDFRAETIKKAMSSVTACKEYLNCMIQRTMWIAKQKNEVLSVAEVVKQYIDHNLEKEISRESLSEMAFLNADYLARIFKKEVGESLNSYIVNQRITIAKDYLIKTNEPVNVIAIKVGYDNFSYFSKVFKAETGMSPKEFRRKLNPEVSEK